MRSKQVVCYHFLQKLVAALQMTILVRTLPVYDLSNEK